MDYRDLSQKEKEIFVGILLGDGSLRTNTDHVTTCAAEFRSKVRPYIEHEYELFKPWTTQGINTIKQTGVFGFATRSLPQFAEFKGFYIFAAKDPNTKTKSRKKIKIVPPNIEELVTPISLAYWFMDDGSARFGSKGMKFHTDNFTKDETERLAAMLRNKFGIICKAIPTNATKKPGQYIIELPAASYDKFKDLVYQHILPCFHFKFRT